MQPTVLRFVERYPIIALLGALSVVLASGCVGAYTGLWLGAHREVSLALNHPVEVRVSGTLGAPTSSSALSNGGGAALLGFLEEAFGAVSSAKDIAVDAGRIPSEALNEYVKGLSGQAGKKTADLFGFLATIPFKPSGDPQADREALAAILITEILNYPPANPSQATSETLLTEQVLFSVDRWNLDQASYETIGKVRQLAQQNSESIVLLFANTDTTGTKARNAELARLRSTVVRDVLISAGGLAANRVFTSELADHALPHLTPPNMAKERNRSVTIQVRR